jgi:hypothetical protein
MELEGDIKQKYNYIHRDKRFNQDEWANDEIDMDPHKIRKIEGNMVMEMDLKDMRKKKVELRGDDDQNSVW